MTVTAYDLIEAFRRTVVSLRERNIDPAKVGIEMQRQHATKIARHVCGCDLDESANKLQLFGVDVQIVD